MSEFSEIPEDSKTPMCLFNETCRYLLDELHPDLLSIVCEYDDDEYDEQKIIEILYEKMHPKLRMYGSPQELLENVKIFKKFPGNSKFMGTEEEPYQTSPIIYKSLKNEEYICKSDVFVILQNMILQMKDDLHPEHIAMIVFHLKSQEDKLKNELEFLKIDEKMLAEIYGQLEAGILNSKISQPEVEQLYNEITQLSIPETIRKFESLSPEAYDRNPKRRERLEWIMERYCTLMEPIHGYMSILMMFTTTRGFLECLQAVIDNRPDVFLSKELDGNTPITIRMFEDGNEKFVMKAELFNAINEIYVEKFHLFSTISMRDVFKEYGDRVKYFEFIRCPILRAKHRAVPIRCPLTTDKFCILAIDAFFDFAKSWIFGFKFFQKFDFSKAQPLFKSIDQLFLANEKNPYFISQRGALNLKYEIRAMMNVKNLQKSEKDVRNAKIDGFSIQNLKNELKYLGLTTTFPEILDFAEIVYSEVDKKKKDRFLRTCDLFDAIEHCQLICILNRAANLQQFVHNQKGCHRIYGYKCDFCENGIQKTAPESSKIHEKMENLQKELAEFQLEKQRIQDEFQRKMEEIEEKLLKTSGEIQKIQENPKKC